MNTTIQIVDRSEHALGRPRLSEQVQRRRSSLCEPQRARLVVLAALALASGPSCDDVDWPASEKIATLRVLGVEAQPPTLAPGRSTELSVFCADGRRGPDQSPLPDVEIAWFAGCDNPEDNDPMKCFARYTAWASALTSPIADTPASAFPQGFGFGPTFVHSAPKDILSEQTALSGNPVRYGTSYVFFAACAGQLYAVDNVADRLPVECRDRISGRQLDQRSFVAGFTTIYSYDLFTSRNPVLEHPSFDGVELPSGCSSAADCPPRFECSTEGSCLPVTQRCLAEKSGACPWHSLTFQLHRDSFSLFGIDGNRWDVAEKALWLDSFTNTGSLPEDDASFSLPAPIPPLEIETTRDVLWRAPAEATEHAHLWAVVRDNRGGLAVWDQPILVR